MKRFHRQCPHCKSKAGFMLTIKLGGYEDQTRLFNGKYVSSERHGADQIEKYAECVACHKSIPTDSLDLGEQSIDSPQVIPSSF